MEFRQLKKKKLNIICMLRIIWAIERAAKPARKVPDATSKKLEFTGTFSATSGSSPLCAAMVWVPETTPVQTTKKRSRRTKTNVWSNVIFPETLRPKKEYMRLHGDIISSVSIETFSECRLRERARKYEIRISPDFAGTPRLNCFDSVPHSWRIVLRVLSRDYLGSAFVTAGLAASFSTGRGFEPPLTMAIRPVRASSLIP
jgi:hypothetical protein